MYNILTLNKITQAGLGKLPHDKFNVGDDIANPDAMGSILRTSPVWDFRPRFCGVFDLSGTSVTK